MKQDEDSDCRSRSAIIAYFCWQKKLAAVKGHRHELQKHSHLTPGKDAMGNHMMTRVSISIAHAANGTNHFHDENREAKVRTYNLLFK